MGKKAGLARKLSGRKFSGESKKARGNGAGGSGCRGGGNRERASAGRARVVGGGGSGTNLGSGGARAVGVLVEACGASKGLGSERGEILGAKKVGESIKGLKKDKQVVPLGGDSKKIQKNRNGVKRERNDFVAGVDLKKNYGYGKRTRKNKNVIYSGVDDDKDDDGSTEEIQFLYMQDKDGKILDESKRQIQENDKVLDEGGRVEEICEDGKALDESEDEIQLLFIQDQNGNVVESHMDGEKVVPSIRKRDNSAGVKINEGKNYGEKNPGYRSSLRVLEKGKEVSADASTDSEQSEVPHKIQDSSESDSTETSDCEDSEELELSSDEDNDHSSDEDYELHNPSNSVYSDDDLSSSSDDDINDGDGKGEGEDKDDDLKRSVEEVLKDEEEEDELEELLKDEDEFEEVLKDKQEEDELEELLKDEDEFEEVLKDEDESRVTRGSDKSRLKKRKFCGINILWDSDGDAKVDTGEYKSVAARLCLRRMSKPLTSKKKQKLGTFSSPFTLTDDETDSSADEDGDLNTHSKDGNDRKYVQKAGLKGKGKPGRPEKSEGFPFNLADDKLNSFADEDGDLNTHSKDGGDRKYVQKACVKGKGKPGRPEKGKGFPFTITDDKLHSSADEDGDLNTHSKDGNNRKYVQKAGEHGTEKLGRPEKGKGKPGRPKKGKGKLGRPAKRMHNIVDSAAISVDKVEITLTITFMGNFH